MKKLALLITAATMLLLIACQNNKPKPISTDGKTAVSVNGKKDSVLNNSEKNYGNSTVAEPCVKCLLTVVQATDDYKKVTAHKPAANISYAINWENGAAAKRTSAKDSVINSLKIDIFENSVQKNKIATFIYDNNLSKLQFVTNSNTISEKVSDQNLKLIRNKCFWGVASSK